MTPHQIFMLYWPAQTLLTAVRLGIFDQLAHGPQTQEQVAHSLGLNGDATGRLLAALTGMGLTTQEGPQFSNAPGTTLTLVRNSPTYVGAIADQHAEQLWPLWERLPTAVREGRPVLREAFGGDRNPFDVLTSTPDQALKLIAGMHAGAIGMGELLATAHNFSLHRQVMDVGGGSGVVTATLLALYPHLRATLFDLPQVCQILPTFTRSYLGANRINAHPGNFFDPDTFPRGCDVAVLCRVLHDWNDEKALQILRNTQMALPPGGVILVEENLLDSKAPGARLFSALSNLTMLVLTDGGRERTAAEYEELLRQAGLRVLGTVRVAEPVAVIKGVKL